MDCSALEQVNFGNIVTIKENAFRNCSKLETFEIKETLNHIDNYAFKGCTKLTNVIFSGTSQLEVIFSQPSKM